MGKLDGIFDDVVVNAKAAAAAVSKKTTSVYDVSKYRITAAEIRSDINGKLRELGAVTYKSKIHNLDMSEQIDALVLDITDLRENLDTINQHIATAKNQKKCPNCESSVPKNSQYCNICGAKLNESDDKINNNQAE